MRTAPAAGLARERGDSGGNGSYGWPEMPLRQNHRTAASDWCLALIAHLKPRRAHDRADGRRGRQSLTLARRTCGVISLRDQQPVRFSELEEPGTWAALPEPGVTVVAEAADDLFASRPCRAPAQAGRFPAGAWPRSFEHVRPRRAACADHSPSSNVLRSRSAPHPSDRPWPASTRCVKVSTRRCPARAPGPRARAHTPTPACAPQMTARRQGHRALVMGVAILSAEASPRPAHDA